MGKRRRVYQARTTILTQRRGGLELDLDLDLSSTYNTP